MGSSRIVKVSLSLLERFYLGPLIKGKFSLVGFYIEPKGSASETTEEPLNLLHLSPCSLDSGIF